jgi:hypothetical protein
MLLRIRSALTASRMLGAAQMVMCGPYELRTGNLRGDVQLSWFEIWPRLSYLCSVHYRRRATIFKEGLLAKMI